MQIFICPECGSSDDLLFGALVRGPDLDARVAEVHRNTCLCEACGYDGEPAIVTMTSARSPFATDVEGGRRARCKPPRRPNSALAQERSGRGSHAASGHDPRSSSVRYLYLC